MSVFGLSSSLWENQGKSAASPGDSEQVLQWPRASLFRFSIPQHHHHFRPVRGSEVPARGLSNEVSRKAQHVNQTKVELFWVSVGGENGSLSQRASPQTPSHSRRSQLTDHYPGSLLSKGVTGYRAQPSSPAEPPRVSLDSCLQ